MKTLIKLLLVFFVSSIVTYGFAAKKESCDPNNDTVKLIKDMVDNDKLATAIKSNQELAKAWDKLNEAGATKAKRTAVELLKGINKHFKQQPFKNSSNLRKDYINAIIKYKGKISTNNSRDQGSNRFPDKAEVFFNTLADYAKKFDGKTGFTLRDAGSNLYTQDGFYFSMRYMNSKISSTQVTKLDMRFENEGGSCNGCRFDLETGSGLNAVQYEFKSYKDSSKIPLSQFKSYLERAQTTDSFKYVFNKDKASLSEVREGMVKFMSNESNKVEIWDSMSDELKQSLFPNQDISLLSEDSLSPEVINQMVNQFVEVY